MSLRKQILNEIKGMLNEDRLEPMPIEQAKEFIEKQKSRIESSSEVPASIMVQNLKGAGELAVKFLRACKAANVGGVYNSINVSGKKVPFCTADATAQDSPVPAPKPQNKRCPPGTRFSPIELSGPGGDKYVPPHAAFIEDGKTVGQCLCPDGKIPNTNLSCDRSGGGDTPVPPVPPPPTPSKGCNNPNNIGMNGKRGPSQDIQTIQEILADYFSRMGGSLDTVNFKFAGKADKYGMFGPATEAAVLNYQKRNGLGSDGCVGKITACSLLKEIFTSKTYTVRSILGLTKKKCEEAKKKKKKSTPPPKPDGDTPVPPTPQPTSGFKCNNGSVIPEWVINKVGLQTNNTDTPGPKYSPALQAACFLQKIDDDETIAPRQRAGDKKGEKYSTIDVFAGDSPFQRKIVNLAMNNQLSVENVRKLYNEQAPASTITMEPVKESKNWLDRTREKTTSNLFERLVKDATKKVL